jgi:long-chain acyl-CoA synthetase
MTLVDQAATSTLPKLLQRNAEQDPKGPGIREKSRGVWQTLTWTGYRDQMRDLALGLAAIGFERGDKLSVVGDNRPQLYIAQLSAQVLGGVSVPVYQDSIASELVYVLNHAETSIIVAEDQEQVDKALSLKDKLPKLRWIIYDDPRGLSFYDDPILRSYDSVLEEGRKFGAANPGFYDAELAKGGADDISMIAYTSGTTGSPKGAMLTHRNMIATAEAFIEVNDVKIGDNWLSYLPMAWVGDAAFTLGMALVARLTVNCPESPETVQRDLRELGPDAMLAPPRIWENMLTLMQIKGSDASPMKRRVFEHFRGLAERCELKRSDGKPLSLGDRLGLALGEIFVYGPVRDQLGLRKARWCYTGGAPLGPDTYRFFRSFGINLKQVYGATEASALIACQADSEANPNTVGRPIPRIEVKIDDRGEVLLKGSNVFKGYFKQDEVTRDTVTTDGWLKTGDAGFFDKQGHLVIIDRAKDVGKLSDGSAFAPQFIENKLKFSPYIREAVAFGHERPAVTAMIAIDPNTVGSWAERRGVAYTSYTDLSQKPEVRGLIRDEIRRGNETLPDAQKVRRFLLLTKDLEADDAEMTRTRKVRRLHVTEKYAPVIEAFYAGRRDVELSTAITYEDGRQGTLRSTVHIEDVEGTVAHV